MSKKLVSVVAAMLALAVVAPAEAAGNAYLKLKGQKLGNITGGVTQKGREGQLQVISASHEIVSPRDAASGLATGKRTHKPFMVTVETDKALPLLLKAMTTNENLPEVDLTFYRAGTTGAETLSYSVKLTNASIASIRFVQPNSVDPATRSLPQYVELSFAYQKIDWTWNEPGGSTAADNWAATN